MLMELRVVSAHQSHLKDKASIEFEGDLLSIGRSSDNHWVLPDENLHLSGKHCIINRKNDQYVLTDLSTNGVFIDSQELPLGRGRSAVLKHGTMIRMGDYRIAVSIDQPNANSSYAELHPTTEPVVARGVKKGLEAVLADKKPLATTSTLSSAKVSSSLKTVSDHLSPECSSISLASPKLESATSDHEGVTPLFTSQSDQLPPKTLLPEDWYLASDEKKDVKSPSISGDEQAYDEIEDRVVTDLTKSSLDELPEKKMNLDVQAKPSVVPISKEEAFAERNTLEGEHRSNSEILKKILIAADMDPSLIKNESDLAEKIGELLKNFSNGMIKALSTRSLVKGEFRLQQTMIQPTDNNPFKFSPTGREALSIVLFADSQAYQTGEEAVLDSYTDIQAHQLAMMSGVQEALFKLLAKVDPDVLEEKFLRKPRHFQGVPGLKKVNFWEEYKDFYEELKASMSDDLQGFFIKEFGTAYEEQLEKINRKR